MNRLGGSCQVANVSRKSIIAHYRWMLDTGRIPIGGTAYKRYKYLKTKYKK